MFDLEKQAQIAIEDGVRRKVGERLAVLMKDDDTVVLEPLGIVGYYARNKTIYDYPGLGSKIAAKAFRESAGFGDFCDILRPTFLVLREGDRYTGSEGDVRRNIHEFDNEYRYLETIENRNHEFDSGPLHLSRKGDAVFLIFRRNKAANLTRRDPSRVESLEMGHCDGGIDRIGVRSHILNMSGWLALSAERGLLPEAAKVILTDAAGHDYVVPTKRVQRPDVGAHFKNDGLNGAGYTAKADISSLQIVSVRMAYEDKGKLVGCPQTKEVVQIARPERIEPGAESLEMGHCDGSIDGMDVGSRTLNMNGWLALSVERGLLPEAAKVILIDAAGHDYVVPTKRVQRPDVGAHFKKDELNGAGYTVKADISSLQVASVRMAYEDKGKLVGCP
jgi:hypothetical protein